MGFEKDIFISYAHIDNQALEEGGKGWIAEFHRALEVRLSQLLGERPKIWRDTELDGNHNFNDEIIAQFPKIALFISVVSPRYVKSEWCVKEVVEFKKASEKNIGVEINNKSRIFKIVKTPVRITEQIPAIEGLLGYEFYQVDEQTQRVKEFSKLYGSEVQQMYWSKLDDVAHDIAELLSELKSSGTFNANDNSGQTVYLAESSLDMKEERDKIKRWLQDKNCKVLPDKMLSFDAAEYAEQVDSMLQECDLVIHPIGSNYGMVLEGAEESKIAIQNQIAAKVSKASGMERVIWMPPTIEVSDTRQQTLIQNLKTNPELQYKADVIIKTLDDLKFEINDKLERLKEPEVEEEVVAEAAAAPKKSGPKSIYFICDESDLDNIAEVEDYLFDQGFEIVIPLFEGEISEIRQDHEANIKNCDAVILFYGNVKDSWLRSNMRDFLDLDAFGRKKPLNEKAVIISGPESPQKRRFRSHDFSVIKMTDGLDASALAEFCNTVKQS